MLEVQSGVVQETEGQAGTPSDANAAATERHPKRVEGRRTHIGQFPAFEVAPDELDGVQLRGVARQAFDLQPRALVGQVLGYPRTLVPATRPRSG